MIYLLLLSCCLLFLSFSLFLLLLHNFIGTDDERLHSSLFLSSSLHALFFLITRGGFHARLKTNLLFSLILFVFISSGATGLLLFVYIRIIVQALTCKLPIAYCTCNSFSTAFNNKRKKRKKNDR